MKTGGLESVLTDVLPTLLIYIYGFRCDLNNVDDKRTQRRKEASGLMSVQSKTT